MVLTQGSIDRAVGMEADFERQYNEAMTRWTTDLQTGVPSVEGSKQALDRVMTSWRQYMYELMDSTKTMTSDTSSVDKLTQLASELGTTKAELASLQSKGITRSGQTDSVNPKVKQSPYTNILGLRRMFREPTRWFILIASIVFGVLAVSALGFLGYQMATVGIINPSFITGSQQAGGARNFDSTR
jgi:hypothetical protein